MHWNMKFPWQGIHNTNIFPKIEVNKTQLVSVLTVTGNICLHEIYRLKFADNINHTLFVKKRVNARDITNNIPVRYKSSVIKKKSCLILRVER